MTSIAIIGSGIAGLTLARELDLDADITLFEKARGVGGRLATRYAGVYEFDHGAQFFTARSEAFTELVEELLEEGVVKRWDAKFAEFEGTSITHQRHWQDEPVHYIGAPRMNSIGKYLAREMKVELNTKVNELKHHKDKWLVLDDEGTQLGVFDWVISTAPIEQTRHLMPQLFENEQGNALPVMQGCFALMLGFEHPVDLPFEAALVKQTDISWISVNSSKPDRPPRFSMVILATNDWADAHMEHPIEEVKHHLLQEASRVTEKDLSVAAHQDIHRWRYANAGKQERDAILFDAENKLAACGDWSIQGRVEAAFTAAQKLAHKISYEL